MPARPPPPASDCPGSSNAPRQDVARSRARSPHLGAAAIDVAVVACSVPASPAYRSPRRPSTGQECRSWRTAGSKRREPYPAQVAGFISEWWPGSNRNGGRHQIGMPGRIASEFAVELTAPMLTVTDETRPSGDLFLERKKLERRTGLDCAG